MGETKTAAFKVAMRDEGMWIVCYFAAERMYEDPKHPLIEMCRVLKSVLVASEGRDALLEIMRSGIDALLPEGAAVNQEWRTLRAPEDERTGKA